MTEEVLQLQKENQELREALKQTQDLLRVALARIEKLEKLQTPPPAFVKTNMQKSADEEKTLRKKRESQHKRARRRSQPTQIAEHHQAKSEHYQTGHTLDNKPPFCYISRRDSLFLVI